MLAFFKSNIVGLVSTVVNLGLLALLIDVVGLTSTQANFPSLAAGSAVMFFGHRHFAFAVAERPIGGQAWRYLLAECGSFTLNYVGFHFMSQHIQYIAARMLVTFLVYVGYNFPVWKFYVFRKQ